MKVSNNQKLVTVHHSMNTRSMTKKGRSTQNSTLGRVIKKQNPVKKIEHHCVTEIVDDKSTVNGEDYHALIRAAYIEIAERERLRQIHEFNAFRNAEKKQPIGFFMTLLDWFKNV